jgi:hypothetical protein
MSAILLSAVCGVTTFPWIDSVCFWHNTSHNFPKTATKVRTLLSTFFCVVAAKNRQTVTSFCYKGQSTANNSSTAEKSKECFIVGDSEPTLNCNTVVSRRICIGSYFIVNRNSVTLISGQKLLCQFYGTNKNTSHN